MDNPKTSTQLIAEAEARGEKVVYLADGDVHICQSQNRHPTITELLAMLQEAEIEERQSPFPVPSERTLGILRQLKAMANGAADDLELVFFEALETGELTAEATVGIFVKACCRPTVAA